MKKLIATISLITAVGIGAFTLNSVLPAGAVGSVTTQAADPSPDCGGRAGKFKGVLDQLVTDGTITQAQEDAIVKAMKDAVGDKKAGRGGRRLRVLGGMLQVSADTIGVSADDLKTAVKSGQTVADVANAHTVNPSDVVAAIIKAGTAKLDMAVTDGKLTQAQADDAKGRLPELADKFVNHKKPGC
jgi:hypothetical protein